MASRPPDFHIYHLFVSLLVHRNIYLLRSVIVHFKIPLFEFFSIIVMSLTEETEIPCHLD